MFYLLKIFKELYNPVHAKCVRGRKENDLADLYRPKAECPEICYIETEAFAKWTNSAEIIFYLKYI